MACRQWASLTDRGGLPLAGVACRQWVWLGAGGCGLQAVGVTGGGGRGLQAVGVACRQWAWLTDRGGLPLVGVAGKQWV